MGVAIIMPLFASPCFVLFESSLCGGEGEVRRKRREISDGGEGEKAGRGGKKRGAVSVCTVLCREGSRGWNAAWKVKVNRPWQKRRRGRRGWERLCGETPGAAPAGPAAVRSGTGRSERAPSVAGVLRAGALRPRRWGRDRRHRPSTSGRVRNFPDITGYRRGRADFPGMAWTERSRRVRQSECVLRGDFMGDCRFAVFPDRTQGLGQAQLFCSGQLLSSVYLKV